MKKRAKKGKKRGPYGPSPGSIWRGRWLKRKPVPTATAAEASAAGQALKRPEVTPEQALAAGRVLVAYRNTVVSKKRRSEIASSAARAYWAAMSPKERSLEHRRRSIVRKKRRKAASAEKVAKGE